jgi:hypothetical protein
MGGFTSLASEAFNIFNAAGNIIGAYDNLRGDNTYYRDLQRQQGEQMRQMAENAALEKEKIRLSAEQTEVERRAALRRAIAKQKAKYGASGIESSGGSSQALLLGLYDESDEDRQQRESLDALKTQAIDQNLDQQQRINTLQLTQLRERSRYNNRGSVFTALGGLGGILK